MEQYGCEQCGVIGWRRGGESIAQTGEEDGVPVVTRIFHDPGDRPGDTWMAECGHKVRPASVLDRFFSALSPGEPARLPPNF